MLRRIVIILGISIPVLFLTYMVVHKRYGSVTPPFADTVRERIRLLYGRQDGEETGVTVAADTYTDTVNRFRFTVPDGWTEVPQTTVFTSPGEIGHDTYADTEGMALSIRTYPKPTYQKLEEWLLTDETRFTDIRSFIFSDVARSPSIHYKKEWEGLPVAATGMVVDRGDYVLQAECFYPAARAVDRDGCADTLIGISASLVFE